MADLHAQLAGVRRDFPLQQRKIDGLLWPYVEAGSGDEPLLLLPGALGQADTSFQYILALHAERQVLSLSYPDNLTTLPALLAGLPQLLDALAVGRAHVLGGSYSGLVAQHFASAHPQRVASLLLANIGAPDPHAAWRWRLAAAAVATLPQPLLHSLMRATIGRFLPGDSAAHAFWRSYFAGAIPQFSKQALVARLRLAAAMHGAAEQVASAPFRGPVLLVEAEHDDLIPPHQRRRLHSIYPQARCLTFADRGHAASLDAADAYIACYQEFLCALVPAPAGQAAHAGS